VRARGGATHAKARFEGGRFSVSTWTHVSSAQAPLRRRLRPAASTSHGHRTRTRKKTPSVGVGAQPRQDPLYTERPRGGTRPHRFPPPQSPEHGCGAKPPQNSLSEERPRRDECPRHFQPQHPYESSPQHLDEIGLRAPAREHEHSILRTWPQRRQHPHCSSSQQPAWREWTPSARSRICRSLFMTVAPPGTVNACSIDFHNIRNCFFTNSSSLDIALVA
jgi:hypothetical protein